MSRQDYPTRKNEIELNKDMVLIETKRTIRRRNDASQAQLREEQVRCIHRWQRQHEKQENKLNMKNTQKQA